MMDVLVFTIESPVCNWSNSQTCSIYAAISLNNFGRHIATIRLYQRSVSILSVKTCANLPSPKWRFWTDPHTLIQTNVYITISLLTTSQVVFTLLH
jgi:hypothetical protein